MKKVLSLILILFGTTGCINDYIFKASGQVSEVLEDVPVEVLYNDMKYVLEGDIPNTVDVLVTGLKEDISMLKESKEYSVQLDLTEHDSSVSKVYFNFISDIDLKYEITPSYTTVTLSEIISERKEITPALINIGKLDSQYLIKKSTLNKEEVLVKGSIDNVDKIHTVKAIIDIEKLSLKGEGTYEIDSSIVAYDISGNIIDNIEIIPLTVSANIEIKHT